MNKLLSCINHHNKNFYNCIKYLDLTDLFKNNITFLLPSNKLINKILYNHVHDTEEAVKQIQSLCIKGYIPNLSYFDKIDIINFNNDKLDLKEYKITINNNYVREPGLMLYNIEIDEKLVGTKISKKIQLITNLNQTGQLPIKLKKYIIDNYNEYTKREMNIFMIFSNIILKGFINNIELNKNVINDCISRLSYLARATIYMFLMPEFNVFKYIDQQSVDNINKLLENNIPLKSLLKIDSGSLYYKNINTIRKEGNITYTTCNETKLSKIKSLSTKPNNIEFINYLKKIYNDTYNINMLNNHIFTVICDLFETMEEEEETLKNRVSIFKNNFITFINTNDLNKLAVYNNDIVLMYTIFTTLVNSNIFLENLSDIKISQRTSSYHRNPMDKSITYIGEFEQEETEI